MHISLLAVVNFLPRILCERQQFCVSTLGMLINNNDDLNHMHIIPENVIISVNERRTLMKMKNE